MTDPFPTAGVAFYKDKRVIVTGATGLIGSYAVKLLKESGAHVLAVVHDRPPNEFTCLADRVECADFTVPDALHTLGGGGVDVVIGCAGITGGVNLPKIDPVSYVGPATVLVVNTLHACWRARVSRFGFLSSTTVYAPSDRPVREQDVDLPAPLYPLYRGIGESKRWLEKLCRYYHETTGVEVGIVRPSGAYGRFDNFDEKTSHVIPGLITRALHHDAHEPFEVWGDGQDVRDFVHAQDVARGLLQVTADLSTADPVNIASGQAVTTAELAQAVLGAVGCPAPLAFRPDKPSALRTRTVDVSKAAGLGFVPTISLADGLRDTVEWRRSR